MSPKYNPGDLFLISWNCLEDDSPLWRMQAILIKMKASSGPIILVLPEYRTKQKHVYNSKSPYSKLVNYSLPYRARWYHWCHSHHHNHGILSWSRSTQITGQTCLGGKITPSAKSNHHGLGKFFARQIPDTFLPTSSIQVWFMWQSPVKSSEGSKFQRLPCLSFRSKCGSCCKIESLSIWSGRKWMFANSECSPQKRILYL